jgi:hypothetical protein
LPLDLFLNHQDTKITKKSQRYFSNGSSLITISNGEMKMNSGSACEDHPKTKELIGVLGALVVNFCDGLTRLITRPAPTTAAAPEHL